MVIKNYQEVKARRQSLFPDSRIRKNAGGLKTIAGGELFSLPSLHTKWKDSVDGISGQKCRPKACR